MADGAAAFAPSLAAGVRTGETHLWLLKTDRADDHALAAWRGFLSVDERARNGRFLDEGARAIAAGGP